MSQMTSKHYGIITTQRGKLMKKASNVLAMLQELDEVIDQRGGSQAKFLMYVAKHHPNPVILKDVQEALDLTQGQISRIAREFHSVNSEGQPGKNLIDIQFDPYAPRTKLITLNKNGEAVLKKIFN